MWNRDDELDRIPVICGYRRQQRRWPAGYQGTINLTGLWHAAGRFRYWAPRSWLRRPVIRRLIRDMARDCPDGHLVVVGARPGAHVVAGWWLALEYAIALDQRALLFWFLEVYATATPEQMGWQEGQEFVFLSQVLEQLEDDGFDPATARRYVRELVEQRLAAVDPETRASRLGVLERALRVPPAAGGTGRGARR
jgi:hypothetical protein